MSAISKEEVALYDRQIRLWGMEAQTRLRSSSICFVGVKALTLEACKNLVLAGIGTLTLVDPHPVTSADLEVQYYFTSDDLGEPRANVLARSLRVLNPLVDIRVSEDVEGKYDVVVRVGTGGQNDERRVSVLADSVGLFGYIFVDCLGTHEYVEEVRPEGEGEVKRVKCVAEYHALAQSLVARVEGSNVQRLRRKYPPLVFVFQALVAAGKLDASSVTAERLEQLVNDMLRCREIPGDIVDSDIISRVAQSWGTEFVPCAAVVGGTLAQEVLKIVTRKDMPVNNWYVYDALKGDGITCKL